MKRNIKSIFTCLYVSLIIPFITIYLLSFFYINSLKNNNKQYYMTNEYSWLIIVIAIVWVLSTYIFIKKKSKAIIYYIVGIFIGVVSILFPIGDLSSFNQTLINQLILIAGYIAQILVLIFSLKFKIIRRDN